MKTLLAVLQLTLVPQVPVPGSEPKAATPPAESQRRVIVFDFEDDEPLDVELTAGSGLDCHLVRRPLVRIRENFDDKVMQSVQEL